MDGSSRQNPRTSAAYVSTKNMAGTLIDLAGKFPYVGIDIRRREYVFSPTR